MRVPGSNLFKQATKMIRKQQITYVKDLGRTKNSIGQYITEYSDPMPIMASVQAMQRDKYQQLGLDLQRNYIKIFASQELQDLERGKSGDKVTWNGRDYQLTSDVDWNAMDGWEYVIAVLVSS